MSSPDPRRRLRQRGLAAAAIVLVLAGAAVAFVLAHSPGNVSHPNVSFTTTTAKSPTKPQPVDNFSWPFYGGDLGRTRDLPVGVGTSHLKVGWKFQDYVLLEFPPVMYGTTMYLVDNYGSAKGIDVRTGRRLWQTQAGSLAAASPALDVKDGLVFVPVLSINARTPGNGRIVALSMKTGRVVWTHGIAAGSESSPVVWEGKVFLGSQDGTVYALNAKSGAVVWTYHASGAVKGGPSIANGIIYFGDYAGKVYALNARNGRQIWAVGTSGTTFGFGSGTFYSSPAVAYGRVYIGNTDHFVYSFSARTGQLAWRTATGSYVYSSPAVENTPGLGPTVYIGSYDGSLYALNARSGSVRWTNSHGGAIDGSPQIIGHDVFYSNLRTKATYAVSATTGKTAFTFLDGRFNPGLSDGRALYLIGYSMIYQLLPASPHR